MLSVHAINFGYLHLHQLNARRGNFACGAHSTEKSYLKKYFCMLTECWYPFHVSVKYEARRWLPSLVRYKSLSGALILVDQHNISFCLFNLILERYVILILNLNPLTLIPEIMFLFIVPLQWTFNNGHLKDLLQCCKSAFNVRNHHVTLLFCKFCEFPLYLMKSQFGLNFVLRWLIN